MKINMKDIEKIKYLLDDYITAYLKPKEQWSWIPKEDVIGEILKITGLLEDKIDYPDETK